MLSALCDRATSPTCGTAAVLRRRIAAEHPTLILDEWDSLDRSIRRSCLNFLNTGFRHDGTYSIVGRDGIEEMSTFCPKAIIGRSMVALPEATLSRCIPFTMQKALPGEALEKFRAPQRSEAQVLRQGCELWAEEFMSRMARAEPVPLASLSARQQDICTVLLAIADDCGGDWPCRVRQALESLLAERNVPTPENELLRALGRFVRDRRREHFLSREFCAWANAQEETPWSEKPLTQAKLAEMLRAYDIFPGQINRTINGRQKNGRGYFVRHFKDAFARYVPDESSG